MGSLLGGNSSQSSNTSGTSFNRNYGNAVTNLNPTAAGTTGASSAISALLGNGGTAEQQAAFNNYLNSSGYNFNLGQGTQAITNNAAARGLLDSGATGKALSNYGQNTANNFLNQYLQQQLGLANLGIQATNAQTGAGQISTSNTASSGSSKQGLGF